MQNELRATGKENRQSRRRLELERQKGGASIPSFSIKAAKQLFILINFNSYKV